MKHSGPTTSPRARSCPARATIVAAIRSKPGISLGVLALDVNLAVSTVDHHLRVLEEAGVVQSAYVNRRRLLYATEARESAGFGIAKVNALLADPAALRVARAIIAHPGISREELVEVAQDSPRVVYHHLKRLWDAGLIRREPPKRYRVILPTEDLIRAIATS